MADRDRPVAYDSWKAARAAYSAWCRRLANAQDNHRYTGPDEPAWEFLDKAVREAWEAAVESVHAATQVGESADATTDEASELRAALVPLLQDGATATITRSLATWTGRVVALVDRPSVVLNTKDGRVVIALDGAALEVPDAG